MYRKATELTNKNNMLNAIFKLVVKKIPENNRLERIWKLAQVDFKKRFYNDKLGIFWALLNPLFSILVFYCVFKYVFRTEQENYGLFLFSGLLLWMYFVDVSSGGLRVIKTKLYLINNIQLNKLDLFFSLSLSVLLGFLFNVFVFLLLCFIVGIRFDLSILYLPLVLFEVVLISFGFSLILSVLKIFLNDIIHLWSVLRLFGFWSSGIIFNGAVFIDLFPPLLYLNPFVGLIMNMRAVTLNIGEWNWSFFFVSLLWGILLSVLGAFLFKKYSYMAIERL